MVELGVSGKTVHWHHGGYQMMEALKFYYYFWVVLNGFEILN